MFIQKATIVVDLGFGDAGKGSIVDYLARKGGVSAVVRFNGGGQAAHNVVTPEGVHHTFAQFGSASFVPGVKTHLSRYMVLDPLSLMAEAAHLYRIGCRDALARLSIDLEALVVTPFHKAANRIREVLRGSGLHGSCGMGVGEAMADRIAFPQKSVFAADLCSPTTLAKKFEFFRKLKFDEFSGRLDEMARDANLAYEVQLLTASDAVAQCVETYSEVGKKLRFVSAEYLKTLSLEGDLIFEAAQGVLLDEWHGFHPYTTWSTTTFDNAEALLSEIGFFGTKERLGVLRAYYTRHGTGPFPTEDKSLTLALPDAFNGNGRWQGGFRVGWFDLVLARYALAVVGGIDALALTNIDRMAIVTDARVCIGYKIPSMTRTELDVSVADSNLSVVKSLRRKPFLADLQYQETLTRIIERAQPIYAKASVNEEYVQMIGRELKVPITITSHGPTASHKRARALHAVAA
jgi:adenylosuccinate synthase